MKALNAQQLTAMVEQVHLALMFDHQQGPQYRAFLEAVDNAHAVEGSTKDDDMCAANMIREWAQLHALVPLSHTQLAAIIKHLKVVLNRCGLGRMQRRNAQRRAA
jgi:hypothetical protein